MWPAAFGTGDTSRPGVSCSPKVARGASCAGPDRGAEPRSDPSSAACGKRHLATLLTESAAWAPSCAQLRATCDSSRCCWLGCRKAFCQVAALAAASVGATSAALSVPALTLRAELGAGLSACRPPPSAEAAEGGSRPRAERLFALGTSCGAVPESLATAAPCAMLGLLLHSVTACLPAPDSAGSCCLAPPASSPATAMGVAVAGSPPVICFRAVGPAVGDVAQCVDTLRECTVRRPEGAGLGWHGRASLFLLGAPSETGFPWTAAFACCFLPRLPLASAGCFRPNAGLATETLSADACSVGCLQPPTVLLQVLPCSHTGSAGPWQTCSLMYTRTHPHYVAHPPILLLQPGCAQGPQRLETFYNSCRSRDDRL